MAFFPSACATSEREREKGKGSFLTAFTVHVSLTLWTGLNFPEEKVLFPPKLGFKYSEDRN